MRPTVTEYRRSSLVCLSVVSPVETAEPIEVAFGMNHVLDSVQILHGKEQF